MAIPLVAKRVRLQPLSSLASMPPLVWSFPSTILGGFALGYVLDRLFETSPWFIVTTTLFALVGAFVRMIFMLQKLSGGKK